MRSGTYVDTIVWAEMVKDAALKDVPNISSRAVDVLIVLAYAKYREAVVLVVRGLKHTSALYPGTRVIDVNFTRYMMVAQEPMQVGTLGIRLETHAQRHTFQER